jgi:hypothetical protein
VTPPNQSKLQEDFMKILAIAAMLLAAPALPASAALSGFYDSGEQISTILMSEAVGNALRQAPIGSISNTGTRDDGAHEWEVRTQECDLKVYLVPHAPAGVGKTTYTVDVPNGCK